MTSATALPGSWQDWPIDAKLRLRDELRRRLNPSWPQLARPEQTITEGRYLTVLAGGRGSGKTRAGAEWLAEQLAGDGDGDVSAIVAPTFGEGRDKCVEGVSGLLPALRRRGLEPRWNRTIGELYLASGAKVTVDEAYTGGLKIQGENLRRAWCDEVGLWRRGFAERCWDESLLPAVRLGRPQVVCTFTPKRTALAKRLLGDPQADVRRMSTFANAANLADEFLAQMRGRYEGTRLGRQELDGILLEDVEGALWRFAWIERHRRAAEPYTWQRKRVAIDPSDGLEDGDEQGLAVVGLGGDWGLYVIESDGLRTNPYGLCKHAIGVSERHGRCPIVVEKNHGGEALRDLLELAMQELGRRVPYHMVHTSRSKLERADPIAALYEQEHRGVHHLDVFPELEEQMTSFTGQPGERSPDRLDALVHGLTDLIGGTVPAVPSGVEATPVPWSDRPRAGGAVAWR